MLVFLFPLYNDPRPLPCLDQASLLMDKERHIHLKNYQFKFQLMWKTPPQYSSVVEEACSKHFTGSLAYKLKSKFQNTTHHLKNWDTWIFGKLH